MKIAKYFGEKLIFQQQQNLVIYPRPVVTYIMMTEQDDVYVGMRFGFYHFYRIQFVRVKKQFPDFILETAITAQNIKTFNYSTSIFCFVPFLSFSFPQKHTVRSS